MKDIQITNKNGRIRICWRWSSEDIEHVSIFYKRKEDSDEWRTRLNKHKIYRVSTKNMEEAEMELTLERGLYTFIFLINEGEAESREIVCDDIMLGEPFRIRLEWQGHKAGTMVTFLLPEGELPGNTLLYEADGYKHVLSNPIRKGFRLLIPNVFDRERIRFRIIEPYNKVYVLI